MMDRVDKVCLIVIVSSIIFVILVAIINYPGHVITSKPVMTQEEAKYQYCLIETQLKYPTSSTDIVKRLCELEQIGRLKG